MLKKALIPLALAISVGLFATKAVSSFDTPLYGLMDTETWEYNGYFVRENLSFRPLPTLNFENDGTLYPYGTNQVFQAWGLERDFYFAFMHATLGNGPWLQLYYTASVALTVFAVFLLLRRSFGDGPAALAAISISFFNFYATYKYPFHVCYAAVHWLAIGMVLDFLIYREWVQDGRLNVRRCLLRGLVLVLSLGLDLGTIAGFAIFSFLVTASFLTVGLLRRAYRDRAQAITGTLRSVFRDYAAPFNVVLLALLALAALFYIPLILQIMENAKYVTSNSSVSAPDWYWWANPARIFLPFISKLNPGGNLFMQEFGDLPEGQSSGSAGLFLLIFAAIGLWHSRSNLRIFAPLLVIFFAHLTYEPTHFPSLRIFPWFEYYRVAPRGTVNYAIVFAVCALGFDYSTLTTRWRRGLFAALLLFGLIEVRNAYSARVEVEAALKPEFFEYMNTVKSARGTAILDWPFCVSGGNDDSRYCPFPRNTAYSYALRRFHEKKVIGQYFGRLQSYNLAPLDAAGWNEIRSFQYDTKNPMLRSKKDAVCFSEQEWRFFDRFYRSHDFAGIQLHESVVPADCAKEFFRRYGEPAARTIIPYTGGVAFIDRPD